MSARTSDLGRSHVPSASVRRREAPADRRAAIRSAALELFATIGYRATTMADIGEKIGIRGPSLYKHVTSKHALLAAIVTGMMNDLLAQQSAALAEGGDVRQRLRRITIVHVQYHAEHRYEAFVGHREIDSIEEPDRSVVLDLRRQYEREFRKLVREGRQLGVFSSTSDRLSSYAILDMGIGVSAWYNPDGPVAPSELATTYAGFAEQMLTATALP
jgi:AcrR family transcriptional regulator